MRRRRRSDVLWLALSLCAFSTPAGAATADSPPGLTSLADVYDHGLRDTNGDGLADSITARVIMPAAPSMQDVQAAANIAARLGYESTAASLPIVFTEDKLPASAQIELPILVGRENRYVRALMAAGAVDVESLVPGQGLIALVPNAMRGRTGIVVVGSDDAGTLSASTELAARLPHLWNMTGITLPAIQEQALAYLRRRNVSATEAFVTSIIVDANRRGISSINVRLRVAADAGPRALEVLRELEVEHRFGREVGTLDFAPVASIIFGVDAGTGSIGRAVVRRTGPNWRTLIAPPPSAPVAAASSPAPVRRPTGGPPARRSRFFLNSHDGMFPGGGGANYGFPIAQQIAPAKAFDLSDTYTANGWFGDLYQDLVPDSIETSLILGGNPLDAIGAAHIAARLGLETTGITLPLTKRDAEVAAPQNELSPILVGRENTLVQSLIGNGKTKVDGLRPGEGIVEIVLGAFGDATATIVAGADSSGTNAAALHLTRRLPSLWDTQAGAPTIQDLENETADFLAGRNAAGQAARASIALDQLLREISRGSAPLESLTAKLYLEEPNPQLATFLKKRIGAQARRGKVSVVTEAITQTINVIDDPIQIPWEGTDFWSKLRSELLPKVKPGSSVRLEARLSEDPAVRRQIEKDVSAELRKAGAVATDVRILSAYKQGFFWLTEEVLPTLKARGAKSVHIKVRAARPNLSKEYRFHQLPARWIKELYPADEVYNRELGMAFDAFQIEQVDEATTTYSLQAMDEQGKVVLESRFDPVVVKREFLDTLPGQSVVDVETGRIFAAMNDIDVIDARIETDLERLWNHYQVHWLPKFKDWLTRPAAGAASPLPQPLIRDLKINVSLSEPDYDIGEGEHISSVEALAHELYMVTNSYIRLAGASAGVRVIPIVQPKPPGDGSGRFILTRNSAAGGQLDISYKLAGGGPAIDRSINIAPNQLESPRAMRLVAREDRVREIELRVGAASDQAAHEAAEALGALGRLHQAGLFRQALSYAHVDAVAIAVQGPSRAHRQRIANTGGNKPLNAHVALKAPSEPLVTWDHIIGPEESERIVRALSYFPQIDAYKAGKSYEGRDISVVEITAPAQGDQVSQAKLAAYKPTLMLVGRQHGNEPSSTSFSLRLAEQLARDPAFADIVKRVNVVMLPVMNPDGAALAEEIRKTRPMDIAQPGYLNALGRDVMASAAGLSESEVDPYLWRKWLPDIYLNAHSASSHEVVQPFSGYAQSGAPTYSFRRGWYSLSFQMPKDPRFPEWTEAALALRDAMAAEINANPDVRSANLRDYERFNRWGHRFAPHLEPLEIYKGTMLFYSDPDSGTLLGNRRLDPPDPGRQPRMSDWPLITLDGGTFEAADEGAADHSLQLAAQNGFLAVLAHLKYLRDGDYKIERIEEDAPGEGAKYTTIRVRPVMPPKAPQQ